MTIVGVYSCIRVTVLVTGDRPNISSFTVQNERNGTELVDLNEHNFHIAFAALKIEGE